MIGVNTRPIAFHLAQVLESEALFCDLGRLTYLFHRITPEKYPVRFDTRFYLAALPGNQAALTSSEEVSESLWLTPKTALEESASGKFPMMPPTVITLRALAEHGSWHNLRAAFPLVLDKNPPSATLSSLFL